MMPMTQRRDLVTRTFAATYEGEPELWVRAPGRVDLMGSHTDYNLGYVLTLPIGRDTWMAARPRTDGTVRVHSMNLGREAAFSLSSFGPDRSDTWGNYVRAVASALQDAGHPLCGFDAVIHSTVPIGSGLSSSAALECATATVFEAFGGWRLSPVEKALLCQKAENQFVGVNCGLLDQYTSCAGKAGCALLLDCRDVTSRPVQLAPGIQVVICDTRSRRELSGSEYGLRRSQCSQGARWFGVNALREVTLEQVQAARGSLPEEVFNRCLFIVEENERVLKLAEALPKGDYPAVGKLTGESFAGACDLYEIGAPVMHSMMRAMLSAPGVIGARQAGAGFGGCMVAFVEEAALGAFKESVNRAYLALTGIIADVYAVAAAPGAGLLKTEPAEAGRI